MRNKFEMFVFIVLLLLINNAYAQSEDDLISNQMGTQSEFISIDIVRSESTFFEKILFADNISSQFDTWTSSESTVIRKSDVSESKEGKNSMIVEVRTDDGGASIFYNYLKKDGHLQDWSNYNYLVFWFKGQDSGKTIKVGLQGDDEKSRDAYTLVDDSKDWKKITIPLHTAFTKVDLSKIRLLEILFSEGIINKQYGFDDVELVINNNQSNYQLSKDKFIYGENLKVFGKVKIREGNSAISFQIFNPINNLITIKQITPDESSDYSFILPTKGTMFTKEGTYTISAQYGVKKFSAKNSFALLLPHLEENYNGFSIYSLDNQLYGIPSNKEGFDVEQIKNNQYRTIFTGTISNIKESIDKTIKTLEIPVVEDVSDITTTEIQVSNYTLKTIWSERQDLQKAFPEVVNGNFTNLRKWAETTGWNEDVRLSILIPVGKIPQYSKSIIDESIDKSSEIIPILQIGVTLSAVMIGGLIGYKFYRSMKKSPKKQNE